MKYLAMKSDRATALAKGFEIGVAYPESENKHVITIYHGRTTPGGNRGHAIGTLNTDDAIDGAKSTLNPTEKAAARVNNKVNHDKWVEVAACLMIEFMSSGGPLIDFTKHVQATGETVWRSYRARDRFVHFASEYFTDHEARRQPSGAEASE